MRIITGKAKGIVLKAPKGDSTRPTAERVKEAVFSMLQFDIEGRSVLDLFAGSGQMGLEALSRGALKTTFVDKSRDAVTLIKENLQKTKLSESGEVFQSDYLDFIRRSAGKQYDIVIVDPPYALKMYNPALRAMLCANMLKPSTFIICESGEDEIFNGDSELQEKFEIAKQSKYGNTFITVLKLAKED